MEEIGRLLDLEGIAVRDPIAPRWRAEAPIAGRRGR
jgi:hypothetical protein